MAYGAREHKQRKRNPIEKKSHNNTLISNSVNYNLKKKKKDWFQLWVTFITVSRNYTSEWNDY